MKPGDINSDGIFITQHLIDMFGYMLEFFTKNRPEGHTFPDVQIWMRILPQADPRFVEANNYAIHHKILQEGKNPDGVVHIRLTDLGKTMYGQYVLTRDQK